MKRQSFFMPIITFIFFLPGGNAALAGKVYQWTDEEGGVHLSNVPAGNAGATIAYAKAGEDKIYRWTDEEGGVHFSDTPPEKTPEISIREIRMDDFDKSGVDPDRYSIVNQAKRMAEYRRRLKEERLLEKQIRLEERQIAEEREVMRLNKLLREQGYGQRPYGFPFAQVY